MMPHHRMRQIRMTQHNSHCENFCLLAFWLSIDELTRAYATAPANQKRLPSRTLYSSVDAMMAGWCLAGAVVTLYCCKIVRGCVQLLTQTVPNMGVVYPVILSPVLSIPLGILTFVIVRLITFIFDLRPSRRAWFFIGCVSNLVLLAFEVAHRFL